MRNLSWINIYFSPFKPIIPKFYIGKIAIGTPYFYPRRWVKDKQKVGYLKAVPRIFGFDFVSLGWKTKWSSIDYRFEWSPIWSFVFFRWQIALIFSAPCNDRYWKCWLYYYFDTDKSKTVRERIKQAREGFPCIWKVSRRGKEDETICYWDKILKEKYL